MCALKQLISPVNMFFYSDVRIWLEGAAVATAPFFSMILMEIKQILKFGCSIKLWYLGINVSICDIIIL